MFFTYNKLHAHIYPTFGGGTGEPNESIVSFGTKKIKIPKDWSAGVTRYLVWAF